MKGKDNNLEKNTVLASVIIFIIIFTFAVVTPVSAQRERRNVPEGVFENRHLNRPVEIDGELIIEGNIGPEGDIEGEGALQVRENVNGRVNIAGSIKIGGNIDSNAEVSATDDIEVGKSVSGKVRSRNNVSIGEDLKEEGSVTLETPGKTLEIGGAMEGDATITENAGVSIGEVPEDVPVDISIEASPLDGVSISVQNEITDLDIEISNLKGEVETDIDTPEGAVYNYQEIDATATEEEIDEAKLNANVEKSWLQEQGIGADSVRINRYQEGEWVELPTEVVDENATHVEIETETPGFSTFSITAEEPGETPVEGLPWMLIAGIIIVVAIIVIASVLALKR